MDYGTPRFAACRDPEEGFTNRKPVRAVARPCFLFALPRTSELDAAFQNKKTASKLLAVLLVEGSTELSNFFSDMELINACRGLLCDDNLSLSKIST
jgi:hypothetical protein